MNSSLSLTLDAFYTETTVTFDAHYSEDVFILDGILQNENKQKVKEFLNLVRQQADCTWFAKVESQNFVPTAAGLASSASGLAALAGACNVALGLNLSAKDLSRLARRGSGSACRSILVVLLNGTKATLMKRRLLKIFQPIIGKTNWPCSLS